jgi:hypothetical protein
MQYAPELPKAQYIIQKYDRMKGERVNWDEYWEDLAEYFIPNKDDVYGYKLQGERKHNRLYDSTSIMALEMLSSNLHGMLTNPSSVWFNLSTGDEALDQDKEVMTYLQTCVRTMIATFNKSNFQEEIHETYVDLGGIGTTVLAIEEDDENDVRFRSEPIYDSYVSENHLGIIDTRYTCMKWSLRKIRMKFGDAIFEQHLDLKQRFEKDSEQCEEIIYAVYPSEKRKGKFESVYVLRSKQLILEEGTFNEWPFAIPRWSKLNKEVYGRCPAMKALPDVKMLNAVMRTQIRGMQKAIDPPLMVPDNGFLLPINTTPGGTNFFRTGMKDRIEPFPAVSRPDIGEQFLESVRGRIREHFYWEQMQLIQQRDMTATEVMQRTDERLRFLGPVLGRLNNELLRPIIDRVFAILERRGRFPKPPAVLARRGDLNIVYTSQIARAQRTAEANTLIKVLQATGPMIQVQPDIMDNLNGDQILRFNANIFGLPHEMLLSTQEVQKLRSQRQQAQQQAAMAQQNNIEADTQQKIAMAQKATQGTM